MAAHRRQLAAFAASLSVSALAFAAPAHAETLLEALSEAYQTNPTLRAERALQRATDENLSQAWANARPTVSGDVRFQRNDISRSSPIFNAVGGTEVELNTVTAGVTGELPLFRGFRTYNEIKQAHAEIRAGVAELSAVEQEVMVEAVTAYMDVRRDEATLELRANNVAVLERQLEAANARFEVGDVTRTDVAQAEARVAGAKSNYAAAVAQLGSSRAVYAQIIGRSPGTLTAPPALPELPSSIEDALDTARERAPSLIAARAAEEASRRNVAINKGALLPEIRATASYQYSESQTFGGDESNVLAYGARATIPLYRGGAQYSRVRQARHLNSRDRILIADTDREVRARVVTAWERLHAAEAVITAAEQQVRSAEIAFDGVKEEAFLGARTTLDVLDAEQELLDARVSLVSARRDEYVASFNLLAAHGLATAEAIGLNVAYYDAEAGADRAGRALVGFGDVNE